MKKVSLFFIGFLLLLQLFSPNMQHNKPDPKGDFLHCIAVPEAVGTILKRACYDCHSDEPNYAWFDYIAPLSWYVVTTRERAKLSLNFSKWKEMEDWQKRLFLQGGIPYDIQTDRMPPKNYLWLHPDAKISPHEKVLIDRWLSSLRFTKE